MTRISLATATLAVALLSAPAAPSAPRAATTYIVPPGGEVGVKRALAAGGELPDGWRVEGIETRKVRVFVRFVRADATAELVLDHPSAASSAARRAGAVAIDLAGAPRALADAVVARLAADPGAVRWQEHEEARSGDPDAAAPKPGPVETPAAGPGDEPAGGVADALFALGRQVEHLVARGDLDEARRLVRALDVESLTPGASVGELAVLYMVVGDAVRAQQLAKRTLGTPAAHLGRVVLEPELDAATLIDGLDADAACRLTQAAVPLRRLGRPEQAEALLRAIATQHPACLAAVTGLALSLIGGRRGDEALAVTAPALEAHPDDPEVLMVHSSALRLVRRLTDAIDIVERLVRSPDRRPGNLGMLLAMYLREGELGARTERWKEVAAREPDDLVAPFMIGVLLHYGNHFRASNAWLVPLHDRLAGEPRLYVYRAMNEFNLGRGGEARRMLDHAAGLPVVDPDVYYCRAEITRDTERDLAVADLERYLSLTDGTPHASDAKQARVHEMLDELRQCVSDGTPHCGGPWEHPRRPTWKMGWGNLWPFVFAVCGLLLAAVLRRRFA